MIPESTLIKLFVVVATGGFLLGGLLRGIVVYLSWPADRMLRTLGTLGSLWVGFSLIPLLGNSFRPALWPLLMALTLLALWQVLDALIAIRGLSQKRIRHVAAQKEVHGDYC